MAAGVDQGIETLAQRHEDLAPAATKSTTLPAMPGGIGTSIVARSSGSADEDWSSEPAGMA